MRTKATAPQEWTQVRPATLKDVARAVGVCESTVSVVLNGARSGTRVSEKTRKTVENAARELGYRPNGQARSLVTGRTGRVAAYSGSSIIENTNCFFFEIMCGMLDGCQQHGLNLMIHGATESEEELISLVSNRSTDGLMVIGNTDDPIIPILTELKVPAVAVGDTISSMPAVVVDDAEGGRLQAEYLYAKGHRRILYRQSIRPYLSAATRYESFMNVAGALGIKVISTCENHRYMTGLLPEEAEALAMGTTAIVGWEDLAAGRICDALDEHGYEVGKQVAVISFNGFQPSMTPKHRLTTVSAPWSDVGRNAVSHLSSLIHRRPVPAWTCLPVSLALGETA
jgi:DNA-binding LacI/PurR family transcriptional regulator